MHLSCIIISLMLIFHTFDSVFIEKCAIFSLHFGSFGATTLRIFTASEASSQLFLEEAPTDLMSPCHMFESERNKGLEKQMKQHNSFF